VPVFQDVSQEFLDGLRASVDFTNFEPGQMICRQGDLADCFYLIRLGLVKVSREFAGGEMVLTYLSRGDYFGEMGLLPPAVQIRAVGPEVGQRAEVYLAKKPVVGGRRPGGQPALAVPWDEFISREHFEIWMDGTGVHVKKRPEARNPIAFQFGPGDEATVQPGESFSIGETKFEIIVNREESGHRMASCSAMDFVQLVRIEAEKFRELITRFPEVGERIEEEARARRQMDARILNSIQTMSLEQFLTQDLVQGQNMLLFDLEKCTRCDECVKACIATHDDGVTRLIREGLRFEKYLVPTSCRACTDPVCMTRCPVGSIRRKGTLDIVIENWCIGCTNCATDCPFGNINMVPISGLVQIAGSGAKEKQKAQAEGGLRAATCDLCVEYKEPNCVRACPHDAAFRVDAREFFSELRVQSSQTQSALAEPVRSPSGKPAGEDTIVMTRFQDFSAMLPKLRVFKGEKSGSTLALQHPTTAFGRGPDNDHQFAGDAQISRQHCRIRVEVGKFVIEDLGSNNGTFLNGNRVTEAQLHEGDIIRIGETELEFTGRALQ
jgi:Fe-S-cluster-containing dehydrogenase component